MQCSKCHKLLPDNINYCPYCGANLRGIASQRSVPRGTALHGNVFHGNVHQQANIQEVIPQGVAPQQARASKPVPTFWDDFLVVFIVALCFVYLFMNYQ